MVEAVLIGMGALAAAAAAGAFAITRDGSIVTPRGAGKVSTASGIFEGFPLPDYAQKFVSDDYKSYLIEVEPGIKVHILEVGGGYPVFMQHGNPTSGFLYRKVAEHLPLDQVRLIMPTLVGLGYSSKVPVSMHTAANHNRWINAALGQLGLEQVIYVGQDWGGPIGVGALALSPGLVRGIVIMNTAIRVTEVKTRLSRIHDLMKTPIVGEFLGNVRNMIFRGLHRPQHDPASMPQAVKDLYARPVRESGNHKAPLAMMRMVPDGPDHPSTPVMRELVPYVRSLDVPVEIVWGTNDPILGHAVPAMLENFPQAPVTETPAGHFLQEEVPEVIAEAVLRVLGAVRQGGPRASVAAIP
ncbi:alpha/beta fold hydrolase [Novosphingobium sp.]|uniref:alpha/beta fold hydrolase n=1 Tax=Novosphingobium sp. TaxID=1874826 RepID=UPI001DEBF0D0|nr:alpha/beta fold hydrolase [Novosphingobium sp.]MBX9662092.1 alpha/beta fold hydrolase [Novosphingobium sp.]